MTPERVPTRLKCMRSKISFFVDDDSGSDGAYETFSDAADDCMLLEVNNITVRIWVDLHLNGASEEPE
jgi:hypothetical protein